jgi:hypothetical protein
MGSDLPVPVAPAANSSLDRPAVERVLARAAQLQGQTITADDAPDLLSDEQVIAAGAEVGLSVQHLRQAIAEERTRILVPTERGLRAQVAGASWASASRTVTGTPASVLESLNATLTRDESLAIKRRYAERWTWEPRRDFWAMFRRIGGWRFDLQHASEIAATVIPVDEKRVTVRLDADVSRTRNERLEQGAGVAVGGVASGGVVAALASVAHFAVVAIVPIAAVPVAVGLIGGYALARRHRETVERTQLALDQVLDRLEHGEIRR